MKKSLSIIVPCLNEVDTIEKIVDKILKVKLKMNKEIIIIDGGSTDGTIDILKKKLSNKVSKIIYTKTCGKGESVALGFKKATGDIIMIQDADLEYDPNDYYKLVKPILDDRADVVYGSRFSSVKNKKGYLKNYIANRFLTFLSNRYTKLKLTDMETCYKFFRRDVLERITLEEKQFGMEPELTAKVANLGVRVIEVPISYYPRTQEEGKKINYKDGIAAIKCIKKYKHSK